jgi:hypothetical protein
MLDEQTRQQQQRPFDYVKVSRLAKAVLGISPLGMGASALWALASIVLFALTGFAPVLIVWRIAVT